MIKPKWFIYEYLTIFIRPKIVTYIVAYLYTYKPLQSILKWLLVFFWNILTHNRCLYFMLSIFLPVYPVWFLFFRDCFCPARWVLTSVLGVEEDRELPSGTVAKRQPQLGVVIWSDLDKAAADILRHCDVTMWFTALLFPDICIHLRPRCLEAGLDAFQSANTFVLRLTSHEGSPAHRRGNAPKWVCYFTLWVDATV